MLLGGDDSATILQVPLNPLQAPADRIAGNLAGQMRGHAAAVHPLIGATGG
jgi:hypothetical protein